MVEIDGALAAAERSERVDVTVAESAPVPELDAKLEGRPGGRHEIGFVDSEPLVETADVGKRRFANPDDTNRFRFDEMYVAPAWEQLRQGGRSHPASGAAADNDNLHFRRTWHRSQSSSCNARVGRRPG